MVFCNVLQEGSAYCSLFSLDFQGLVYDFPQVSLP